MVKQKEEAGAHSKPWRFDHPGQMTRDGRKPAARRGLQPCTRASRTELPRVSSGICVCCIGGIIFSEGISCTRSRCLSTCTPSRNMSITAIRITTTVRIDRIETYSKNAAVLPNSSIPPKAKIGERMQVTSSQPPAHQPYHHHNHCNGSKQSVTEHFISPYKLMESVYAYLPPARVQIQCHSIEVDRNDQSRTESDEAQRGKPECRRGRRRSNLPGS